MRQDGFTLRAQKLDYDLTTNQGSASGDVQIELSQGITLDTPIAEFNTNTRWWKIYSADILLDGSGHVGCAEAEQIDPNVISLIKPRFTVCPGKNPAWQISGMKGTLKPGRYLKIRHLLFRVKSMPVFYFPAAYLPLNETGGSGSKGIQPPEAGHSSKHGFFLKNLFTWPISSQTEGRLFLDFFTVTGIGLGAGWKHTKDIDGQGSEAKLYLLRESKTDTLHGKIDLSVDIGKSDSRRSVVEIHSATNRKYDKKFSSEGAQRDAQIGESIAFVSLQKSVLGIMAELNHIRSLADESKDEAFVSPGLAGHFQAIPIYIGKSGISPFLGFDLSSSHMDWDSNSIHGSGESYAVNPQIGVPLSFKSWANLNSIFSSKHVYYQTTQNETEGWSNLNTLDLTLTGPRVFDDYKKDNPRRKKGPEYIRHLIYPQIKYEYTTHEGIYPASIMEMEGGTEEAENLSFLLINRAWRVKGTTIGIVQPGIDLCVCQTLKLKEDKQVVKIHTKASPHPLIGLNGRLQFDTKNGRRKDIDTDLRFGNAEKGQMDLGWRYLLNDPNCENLNTSRLVLTSKTFSGYRLQASFLYDLRAGSRIEDSYSLFYESICWMANLTLIRRVDEDMIRANLSLIF
ncbi:LPS-assembly protein LptD [bacterium]|nr:LPS-assembly protein LptD [bacterium]